MEQIEPYSIKISNQSFIFFLDDLLFPHIAPLRVAKSNSSRISSRCDTSFNFGCYIAIDSNQYSVIGISCNFLWGYDPYLIVLFSNILR